MYKPFFKRLFDISGALLLIILFLPLLGLVSLVLLINNRGQVFFVQLRPGKNNESFRIIKFKTMNDKKDKSGQLLPDQERITSVGKIIRKTSLDEFPQLINVLLGSMSLVGPRPLLMEYIPLYSSEQLKRHLVKPGITGWAQVNGRNAIGWEEKFKYDLYYVENCTFMLDLKILLITFRKVFSAKGINEDEEHTMKKFTGNK